MAKYNFTISVKKVSKRCVNTYLVIFYFLVYPQYNPAPLRVPSRGIAPRRSEKARRPKAQPGGSHWCCVFCTPTRTGNTQ